MTATTSPAPARKGGRFRNPTILNGVVLAVVVVLVAAIALPASQTPPPAIAELSPQAEQQITDAPDNQTSDVGTADGGGDGSPGSEATTTTTLPPTTTTLAPGANPKIDRAAVRRCVGNPPRQTEDPESPPCVNYFQGDNGGATWKGVTGNEIRVAVPSNTGFMKEIFAHFNARYELYGRKLVAIPVGGGEKVQEMVAKAVEVDQEKKVFASTGYGDASGREYVYYDELAKRGIVSANGRPSQADEADLAANHPYQWSYLPTFDVMSRNEAELICKAVKGGAPVFAGGAERAYQVRKLALVTTVAEDGTGPDNGPWRSIVKGCGVDLEGRDYQFVKKVPGDDQYGIAQAQDLVVKLQSAGVTTVVCHCHTQTAGFYMSTVATKQGYYPEWIVGTYMYVAEDSHVQLTDGQQAAHSFGISWWDKQVPPEQAPWFWAVKDGDPNREFANFFDYYDARFLYNSMRVLVSGIQLAGPNLTPTTFAAGLQKATFPNPNPAAPPYWQASVGFKGKHSFVSDGALVWLSKEQPSSWGNVPGAVCYVRRGVRYSLGKWPTTTDGLFQPPCY